MLEKIISNNIILPVPLEVTDEVCSTLLLCASTISIMLTAYLIYKVYKGKLVIEELNKKTLNGEITEEEEAYILEHNKYTKGVYAFYKTRQEKATINDVISYLLSDMIKSCEELFKK